MNYCIPHELKTFMFTHTGNSNFYLVYLVKKYCTCISNVIFLNFINKTDHNNVQSVLTVPFINLFNLHFQKVITPEK